MLFAADAISVNVALLRRIGFLSTIACAVVALSLPAAAAAKGSAGLRVVVAVVDTGVDARDPALRKVLVPGRSFVADAATVDASGHGTAAAALVAAGCPRCAVMPVRVIDASGTSAPSTLAAGILWAVGAGAKVVNLSVSMLSPDPAVADAVAFALAHGVVVVSSAGNDGVDALTYPAAYPGVVSVAGAAGGAREPWSNYGPWVSVAGPGCSVTQGRGGAYVRFCGTSSAAAVVSGALARALSTSRVTSGTAAVAALAATAQPVGDFVRYGRLDVARLLRALATVGKKT